MDAFEQVVSEILWAQGYWVRRSIKVDLTKEEKEKIGKPSAPRWEIDVVAFKPNKAELLLVECKSYLDSRGVTLKSLADKSEKTAARYKLFHDEELRKIVSDALVRKLSADGLCPDTIEPRLCLVCGHVANKQDQEGLEQRFKEHGWVFWDRKWLLDGLHKMQGKGYENEVSAVVAKLFKKDS